MVPELVFVLLAPPELIPPPSAPLVLIEPELVFVLLVPKELIP